MKIPIYSNLKRTKDVMKIAEKISNESINQLENQRELTLANLDKLGKLELGVLGGFDEFIDLHTKIGITPEFSQFVKNDINLPDINLEDLQDAINGANILTNSLGNVALGTVGGFAAFGAVRTTALHVAISAIKGAAKTPILHLASGATLTGIGTAGVGAVTSGAITTSGGIVLTSGIVATGSGATLGGLALSAAGPIGLIVGGTILTVSTSKMSKKADEAYKQALELKKEVAEICKYLRELSNLSERFYEAILKVSFSYKKQWIKFKWLIEKEGKILKEFTAEERLLTQNMYMLVQLLYHMCQTTLVIKNENGELDVLNTEEISQLLTNSETIVKSIE